MTRLSLLVGVLSIAVTLIFNLATPLAGERSTDFELYYRPVALNLIEGRGLLGPEGEPATWHPPGYSLLLVPVYAAVRAFNLDEQAALTAFSALFTGISGVLIFRLAFAMWARRRAALLVAAVWVTYPFALWLSSIGNPETPFLAFFFGALLLLVQTIKRQPQAYWGYLGVGVLLGISALIRIYAVGTIAAALAVVIAASLPVRVRLACAALVLGGALAVVAPWQAWLSVQNSDTPALAGNAGAHNLREGLTATLANARSDAFITPDVEALKWRLVERRDGIESAADALRVIADEFQVAPVTIIRWGLLRFAQTWYTTSSARYDDAIVLIQIPYFALLTVAAGRAIVLRRSRRVALALLLFVGWFWLISSLTYSLLRYFVPGIGAAMLLLPALIPHWTRAAATEPATLQSPVPPA